MEAALITTNLLKIDTLIESFLEKHKQGIVTMHRLYFHSDDELSIRALVAELFEELRTGCVTFLNKEDPVLEELDPYLFYIVNAFCKKRATLNPVKKKSDYVCPGCLYFKKQNTITLINKTLKCDECEEALKSSIDPKCIAFFRVFFKHSKTGYHCLDCDRFIPHPADNSPIISCPYFDCCFVGSWANLRRMHHPTITSGKMEVLTLDASPPESVTSFKDQISSDDMLAEDSLILQEELESKIKLIKEVIDYQSNNVPYSSSDFTVKHKLLVYEAFGRLLTQFPTEMIGYLLNQSRSGGFQHKIFQEYIRLLEASLPYNIKKNNKLHKIENLLDENLCLFDGISSFDAIVGTKLDIKNGTEEIYIGGRKASYTKPYYIGKILNILDKKTKKSLLSQMTEYSFSKIKMKDIDPGTEVIVTHLRVPPHYQMGGMVYVNRVRKKIVDRTKFLLSKSDNG